MILYIKRTLISRKMMLFTMLEAVNPGVDINHVYGRWHDFSYNNKENCDYQFGTLLVRSAILDQNVFKVTAIFLAFTVFLL